MIILVQNSQCVVLILDLHSLKQMLDNMSHDLRTLGDMWELHYQIPALQSMPPKAKPQQWAL